MILDILATLFLLYLLGRMAFVALEVWGGPYEEKGKFILTSAGQALGLLAVICAVWL